MLEKLFQSEVWNTGVGELGRGEGEMMQKREATEVGRGTKNVVDFLWMNFTKNKMKIRY